MLLKNIGSKEVNEEDVVTLVRVLQASMKKVVGEKIVHVIE